MHIGRHIVQELVLEFGEPKIDRWSVPLEASEFREIALDHSRGRAHDVSLLVARNDHVALIHRAGHPDGTLVLPSGAIHPEESFVDGARREAFAQTGVSVDIEDYLLQIHASFEHAGECVKWVTHVMHAHASSDEARPDPNEVETVEWLGWDAIREDVQPRLDRASLGVLRYQGRLLSRLAASTGVQPASSS